MTGKDPKDMTAAELLRWAANGELDEYGLSNVHSKLLSALGGESFANTTTREDRESIRALADKIDAEIEEARRDAVSDTLLMVLDRLITLNSYPSRREGEQFYQWLKRCFIPRPRFEDGEPVQFGEDTNKLHGVEKFIFTRSGECCQIQDARGNMQNAFPDHRVKRPAPEVLGADGLPIVEGETVWLTREGAAHAGEFCSTGDEMCGLRGIKPYDQLVVTDTRSVVYGSEFVAFRKCAAWCPASWLTHTPPDTQERIDSDAVTSSFAKYWGCSGIGCDECPASIDGKLPDERYGTSGCREAMILDLLRRQRELDKRMGGE